MEELKKYYNRLQKKNKMEQTELKKTKQLEGLHEEFKIALSNLKISTDNISNSLDMWAVENENVMPDTEVIINSLYDGDGGYNVLASTIDVLKRLVNKNELNAHRLSKII